MSSDKQPMMRQLRDNEIVIALIAGMIISREDISASLDKRIGEFVAVGEATQIVKEVIRRSDERGDS